MPMTPIPPGEHLKQDFMVPLGLSANRLAKHIGVPPNRISSIVAGQRAITSDTALRLARLFGTSPEFWMNLQSNYELQLAVDESRKLNTALNVAMKTITPLQPA